MAHPARLTSHLLARKGSAFPAGGLAANLNLARALPSAHAATPRPPALESRGLVPQPGNEQPGTRSTLAADKVKMTVRLDPDRHSQLRILAARRRCTNQDIMIRALDAYIQDCGGDCRCLHETGQRGGRN